MSVSVFWGRFLFFYGFILMSALNNEIALTAWYVFWLNSGSIFWWLQIKGSDTAKSLPTQLLTLHAMGTILYFIHILQHRPLGIVSVLRINMIRHVKSSAGKTN